MVIMLHRKIMRQDQSTPHGANLLQKLAYRQVNGKFISRKNEKLLDKQQQGDDCAGDSSRRYHRVDGRRVFGAGLARYVLSHSAFFGANPKIVYQEFNKLQTPNLSKKSLCDIYGPAVDVKGQLRDCNRVASAVYFNTTG
jgi:hypothetical protein